MSIKIEGTTIKIYQGDSGKIQFEGLPANALIYMAIRDKKNNVIFPEMKDRVDEEGFISFEITAEMSDKFDVDLTQEYTIYYYGIKRVNLDTLEEDTIFLGDKPRYGDKYEIKVYPKKVEGIYDGES